MTADARAVGVVVVNHNGGDRVLRVLEALRRQRHPLAEIIVVDSLSTDDSPARIAAAFPAVRQIALNRNAGPSTARNVGLATLNAPLALLVDHDVYVDAASIERMVRAAVVHEAAVVCPRIRLIPQRETVQADGAWPHFVGTMVLRNGFRDRAGLDADATEVGACLSACLLVDRVAALEAGGFDELMFFYLEDLEFALRMRSFGHRIWCEPTAEVFHERAAGTPGLAYRGVGGYPARRAYLTLRNRLIVMAIHYRARTLVVLAPVLLLYEMASIVAMLRKGQARQWLRAWGWMLRHLRELRARRRAIQRRRTVGDRRLLSGGPPPLAPGFVTGSIERRLVGLLAAVLDGYWRLARRALR